MIPLGLHLEARLLMRFDFDHIVLGGGIGGLSTAALLARRGYDVVLLEAHTATGGCASSFDRYEKSPDGGRERYRFDVGATTLSALGSDQPLGRLFHFLGESPIVRRIDPGMICHLIDGSRITRFSNREEWIVECERRFGETGQRPFWEEVYSVSDRGWRLSAGNPTFPPKSAGDLIRMARPSNLRSLSLLRYTWTPVLDLLRRYGLDANDLFRRFLDEQLMITAQNRSSEVPFLVGAMGLAYPNDTWYLDGGIAMLAEFLERQIERHGGEVRTRRRVISVEREGEYWRLQTARGEVYRGRVLVSNRPQAHARPGMTSDNDERDSERREWKERRMGWGAFTLYCAVQESFDDLGTLYHQIHTEPLPWSSSESIFVSLSHSDDRLRAREGWRTVTVSTHIASPWEWFPGEGGLTEPQYDRRKGELERLLLDAMGRRLPGFDSAGKKFLLSGTPRTFQFYTGRPYGIVGGVPHTVGRNIVRYPSYTTDDDDFYRVGDMVYPGQGIPAVVLGALNLVEAIDRSRS